MRRIVVSLVVTYYVVYLALIAFVEPLGWFGGSWLHDLGTAGNLVLIVVPLVVALAVVAVRETKSWLLNRRLGVVEVSVGNHRNDAFQRLRAKATSKIVVTGVGMLSLVSYDLRSLREQARSVDIDFLMLDPLALEQDPGFAARIETFFDIPDFASKVRASFDKLEAVCQEWNAREGEQRRMRLRVYNTIPTNSMTFIDPDSVGGEALVEFFLYQSGAKRPRLRVKAIPSQNSMFQRVVAEYQRLWETSRSVVS